MLSTEGSESESKWDKALAYHANRLVAARLAMYDDGLWVDVLRASRGLRQYAERQADQREASPNLKLVVRSVLSPLLQELYPHDDAHAVVAELLRTLGEDVLLLSKLTALQNKPDKTSFASPCSCARERPCSYHSLAGR